MHYSDISSVHPISSSVLTISNKKIDLDYPKYGLFFCTNKSSEIDLKKEILCLTGSDRQYTMIYFAPLILGPPHVIKYIRFRAYE